MKKILLLTYFFPPGNFAASYRMNAWAKHLHEYGYYPIVITRHWEPNNTNYSSIASCKDIQVIKNEAFEVHYLPYSGNLRDRLIGRSGLFILLRKILSYIELVFQNISVRIVPFNNLYTYSRAYLKRNTDIKVVVTSGTPFILFRFAWSLSRAYKIPWIADYRDPWTTAEWGRAKTGGMIAFLEHKLERKICRDALCFTTVSDEWRLDIEKITRIPGFVVYNGFDEDFHLDYEEITNEFTILHIGTMYEFADVEMFVTAVIRIGDSLKKPIRVVFAGITAEHTQEMKIRKLIRGRENQFVLLDRIPKSELIKHIAKANMFLVCANNKVKGWYTTKLFDYLYYRKPILLCPSDQDVIEKIIRESKSGVIANSINEAICEITSIMNKQIDEETTFVKSDQNYIAKFSRIVQTRRFAEVLDQMTTND